jgi:hypothetical protein
MEEIFKITPDKERAGSLLEMAKERVGMIKLIPRSKVYKIIEDYYEIIKELLTAVMYLDGKKTLSHVKLIEYFSERYRELDRGQLRVLDVLRRNRHGIVYYGKKISEEFLINNESVIKRIIDVLIKLVEKKLT